MPALISSCGPFFLAAAVGSFLAVVELFTAFQRDISVALKNRWAWMLIALNALAAVLVYIVVRSLSPDGANGLWTALIVGFTFPAIIRSRFTFYRNPGDPRSTQAAELSLRLDEMYTSVQQRCYTEVNMTVAELRNAWATILAGSTFDLLRHIPNVIEAGRLPDRKEEYSQKYRDIVERCAEYPDKQRHLLALLYIDISPRGAVHLKVRELSRAVPKEASVGAAPTAV